MYLVNAPLRLLRSLASSFVSLACLSARLNALIAFSNYAHTINNQSQ